MPFGQETIDLDEAVDRAAEAVNAHEEAIEEADESDAPLPDSHEQQLVQQYAEAQARLEGVIWARDEAAEDERAPHWDEDVDTVTLQGLTGGEYGSLEDDLAGEGGRGSVRTFLVAKGTAEAPYVDEEQSEDERLAVVSQLPMQYLKWAEHRINDIMSLGSGDDDSLVDVDVDGAEGNGIASGR